MSEIKEEFREKLDAGKEYYEIRLESIGGLGANLCGKMLGELGLKYLEVNSNNFSSYGSEKTGTPVKGYIRYCKKEKEIRLHAPIVEPDLLVVFHQALLQDSSVWKGCGTHTKVLIAIENGQDTGNMQLDKELENCGKLESGSIESEKEEREKTTKQIYGVMAQKIAMDTHSRINVVMLGAILKLMGLKNLEPGERICQDTLGKKYPESLENNLEGMRRGYEEVRVLEGSIGEAYALKRCNPKSESGNEKKAGHEEETDMQWGYLNAPVGGINPCAGSSVINDLSPSRQGFIPIFLKERCINCGLCFSACPDMVFQFAKGKYKGKDMMINQGLDYYHCKGCLRCVDVCPVNALVRGNEAEHEKKTHFMPNQELLRRPDYYEKAGADGYITSESYLTEERMEGGEV